MEEKQNVVEKRIKPGIIRRRAKQEKAEEVPEAAAKSAVPAETALAPGVAPEISQPEEKAPAKGIRTKKEVAEAAPGTEAPPPAAEAKVAEAAAKLPTPAEGVKPEDKKLGVKGPRELPQGPPVGTIIELKKKSEVEAGEAETPPPPKLEELAEEAEKKKLKKVAKKSKVLSDDELDLEGFGRIGHVSQIARMGVHPVADRVFQPTRTGKRRRSKLRREGHKTQLTMPRASKRVVRMAETITVHDLGQQLGVRGNELVKKLMDMGSMVTLNQAIDFDTATLLAQDYQWEVKRTGFEEKKALATAEDKSEELQARAPVVTVMGHVDHGKTSLLDAIRATQVAQGEAGGITQHIGSYRIQLGDGKEITFLDTPGHEAFTQMRARGASVTDVVVLVVAADDGVMPQTIEAINHAKAAGVPMIVAVNKMDKPDAKPDQVKRQLSEQGVLAEDWGGDVLFVNVSAKTKMGIEKLLESIFLQSEILELKANPNKMAKGVIVEARLDRGRGPVATALVEEGTLRVGDIVVAGSTMGKVRAMVNDRGEEIHEARPSYPVEILGLEEVPAASDPFQVLADDRSARQVVDHRQKKLRAEKMGGPGKMSLEDLFSKMQAGEVKELGVVLKADVQGSVEALQDAFAKLPSDKVKIRILHAAAGGITESDVNLANASNGIIIGFNVRPDTKALELASQERVEIKVYKVIYEVLDDVKKAMEGLLEPTYKEEYLGRAEVRQVFTVSKIGNVAGCKVVDGKIVNNAQVRLLRDNVIVYEGKLSSLKRFKDDAKEVLQGFECGMGIEGVNDIKEGDVIECFRMEAIKQKIE
jgi:translation initiation factor IF-2